MARCAEAAPPPTQNVPVAPQQSDDGRRTVRAFRAGAPIAVDGRLEEEVYRSTPPIADFIQQLPREGQPPTEATDVWLLFDDKTLYVSAYCHDSSPGREVATELRRDNINIFQNDNFTVTLDTFYDKRNGFFFQTNPLGAVRDQAIIDGSQIVSWNTVWDVKAVRLADGWSLEMAIPFKSLRYRQGGAQTWGINIRRMVRWKNESSYVTRMPASYGTNAASEMGQAAILVGLEIPDRSRNLEIKPYAVSSLTTDRTATVPFNNDLSPDAGLDLKYGLTRGLVADVTVNTDFAQVEEDLQQVNLTRFSLFFPEKRDFFMEGQGIFAFGGSNPSGGNSGDIPVLFFSRRIGLSGSQEVPVRVGGRVAGKAGRYSIGLVNIETGGREEASAVATNFSTVRIKRDVLRRSNVGLIFTRRTPNAADRGSNTVAGLDANFQFYQNVGMSAYYARTSSPGAQGDTDSYRGRFDYSADRYGLALEHLMVGAEFTPEVGFVRRSDFRRNYLQARFSPRLTQSKRVRLLTWQGSYDYVAGAHDTVVQNRQAKGTFGVEFHNSDQWTTNYSRDFERLPRNFTISPGVVVPAGGYHYQTVDTSYALGQQRALSGRLSASAGSLYGGTKATAGYSGRIGFSPQVAAEPGISVNRVSLPFGDFTATIVSNRFIVAPTAKMSVSSLIQYNASAHTLSSSIRLRWEYLSGSELFLVYSDGRNTLTGGVPDLQNRTVAAKVTRLVRF